MSHPVVILVAAFNRKAPELNTENPTEINIFRAEKDDKVVGCYTATGLPVGELVIDIFNPDYPHFALTEDIAAELLHSMVTEILTGSDQPAFGSHQLAEVTVEATISEEVRLASDVTDGDCYFEDDSEVALVVEWELDFTPVERPSSEPLTLSEDDSEFLDTWLGNPGAMAEAVSLYSHVPWAHSITAASAALHMTGDEGDLPALYALALSLTEASRATLTCLDRSGADGSQDHLTRLVLGFILNRVMPTNVLRADREAEGFGRLSFEERVIALSLATEVRDLPFDETHRFERRVVFDVEEMFGREGLRSAGTISVSDSNVETILAGLPKGGSRTSWAKRQAVRALVVGLGLPSQWDAIALSRGVKMLSLSNDDLLLGDLLSAGQLRVMRERRDFDSEAFDFYIGLLDPHGCSVALAKSVFRRERSRPTHPERVRRNRRSVRTEETPTEAMKQGEASNGQESST